VRGAAGTRINFRISAMAYRAKFGSSASNGMSMHVGARKLDPWNFSLGWELPTQNIA